MTEHLPGNEFVGLKPNVLQMIFQKIWKDLPVKPGSGSNVDLENLFAQRHIDLQAINQTTEEYVLSMSRRANSEHLNLSRGKLIRLLMYAPVTHMFKQFILEGFTMCYLNGIEKNDLSTLLIGEKPITWLLDLDHPEANGIFDENRAEVLEEMAYQHAVGTWLWRTEHMLEAPPEIRQGNYAEDMLNEVSRLASWELKFFEHYGRKPVAIEKL
ncbi:MAG: hypothetical protein Q8R11_01365 [bacterium]|nr:hypothetical protein [bacterium]